MSAVGTEEIVAAVARTYRQARGAGASPSTGDDPVALHAFRARVVDLRYQLALLSCAWPEALNAQAEGIGRSSRGARRLQRSPCAGDIRGGTRRVAAAGAGGPPARMAAKQKKLRRRANVEFERLFAETPNAFATRIAAYLGHPVTKPLAGENEEAATAKAPSAGSL